MKVRRGQVLASSFALAISFAGVVNACSAVEQSKRGNFNAFENATPPQPPQVEAGACTPPEAGGGGGEGGAGGCAVSFKTDVAPLFAIAGPGKCGNGSGCHGPGSSVPPLLPDGNTDALWKGLTEHAKDGRRYADYCSTDPESGYLLCNLRGDQGCGRAMPLGAPPLAAGDLDKIKTWLTCGSPNN